MVFFSLWEVYGGEEGLTCTSTDSTDEYMLCKSLDIRKCTDRTVYCSFPPEVYEPAKIMLLDKPGDSNYGDSNSKCCTIIGSVRSIEFSQ